MLAYLEYCEEWLEEWIKVTPGLELSAVEVKMATEDLHAEEGEDEDEEEEKQQQAGDGAHGVQQWRYQVPQCRPVSEGKTCDHCLNSTI